MHIMGNKFFWYFRTIPAITLKMPSSFAVVSKNFQLHCTFQKETVMLRVFFCKTNQFINVVVID